MRKAVKQIQLGLIFILVAAILGDAQVRDPVYFEDLSPRSRSIFRSEGGHCCIGESVAAELENLLREDFEPLMAVIKARPLLRDYIAGVSASRAANFIAQRLRDQPSVLYRFQLLNALGRIRTGVSVDALVSSITDDAIYGSCQDCRRFPTLGDEAIRQLQILFKRSPSFFLESEKKRQCRVREWTTWWRQNKPRRMSEEAMLPAVVPTHCGE